MPGVEVLLSFATVCFLLRIGGRHPVRPICGSTASPIAPSAGSCFSGAEALGGKPARHPLSPATTSTPEKQLPSSRGAADASALSTPKQSQKPMQGVVTGNNLVVVLLSVVGGGGGLNRSARRLVGKDDLPGRQADQQSLVGLRLLTGTFRVLQPLRRPQLLSQPVEPTCQPGTQDLDMLGGEVEGRQLPAVHRVLRSHEEVTLLVVRPSVGVSAPPGAVFLWAQRITINR